MSRGSCRWAHPGDIIWSRLATFLVFALLLGSAILPAALAYQEDQFELVAGNLLVQNQSFSSNTLQNLFHSQAVARTDTEAFSLSDRPQGGVQLAQTADSTVAAFSTGYFDSSATAHLVLPAPIGQGWLGTTLGDPITVNRPLGYSLLFPQMWKTGLQNSATPVAGNDSYLSVDPENTLAITTFKNNTTASLQRTNASDIKPGDPLSHQVNKPFTLSLTAPSGPTRAKREKVQNMSSWDRFLMNVVGRITTDRAYNGTTSMPVYMEPERALAPYVPFQFLSDAMNMTRPGTLLSPRQWPL